MTTNAPSETSVSGLNIFISHAGDGSERLALALKRMLHNVNHVLDPFVAHVDIEKGALWMETLRDALDQSCGIVCVTRQGLNRPWLNYEAGALSALRKGNMYPLFVGVDPTDLKGSPLEPYHGTRCTREDVLQMVLELNAKLPKRLSREPARLEADFAAEWPALEACIRDVIESERDLPVHTLPPAAPQSGRNGRGHDVGLPVIASDAFCPASNRFYEQLKEVYHVQSVSPRDHSNLWYIFLNTLDFRECKARLLTYLHERCTREPGEFEDVWVSSLLGAAEIAVRFRSGPVQARDLEGGLRALLGPRADRKKPLLEHTHMNPDGIQLIDVATEHFSDLERRRLEPGARLQTQRYPAEARSIKVFIKFCFIRLFSTKHSIITGRLQEFAATIESFSLSVPLRRKGSDRGYILIEALFPCGRFAELQKLSQELECGLSEIMVKETYLVYDHESIPLGDGAYQEQLRALKEIGSERARDPAGV